MSSIMKVEVSKDSIKITRNDKKNLEFERNWLRDQCRCGECYNADTKQRNKHIMDITNTEIDVIVNLKNEIKVKWNDKHESIYKLEFLNEFTYEMWLQLNKRKSLPWNRDIIQNSLKPIDKKLFFNDINSEIKVFKDLIDYGIALIDNVDHNLEDTENVCVKLGGVQRTMFGGMWKFTSNGERADSAYSNETLALHNDNTYFSESAGLQIFHLLEEDNLKGGETILADGFYCADLLKRCNPEYFKILTETPIESIYLEEGYKFRNLDYIIKLDKLTKSVEQIRFNVYDRAVTPFKNVNDSKLFYSSLRKLAEIFDSPDNCYVYKLRPGTVIAIDNFRVLHGRLGFTGKRVMGGAYVSRSDWMSKASVHGLI